MNYTLKTQTQKCCCGGIGSCFVFLTYSSQNFPARSFKLMGGDDNWTWLNVNADNALLSSTWIGLRYMYTYFIGFGQAPGCVSRNIATNVTLVLPRVRNVVILESSRITEFLENSIIIGIRFAIIGSCCRHGFTTSRQWSCCIPGTRQISSHLNYNCKLYARCFVIPVLDYNACWCFNSNLGNASLVFVALLPETPIPWSGDHLHVYVLSIGNFTVYDELLPITNGASSSILLFGTLRTNSAIKSRQLKKPLASLNNNFTSLIALDNFNEEIRSFNAISS